ncbi:MAG: ferritin [Acidimicrobiia bacterium]
MSWNDDLEKAFNTQITLEFASSYRYLALAGWLESAGFPGMATWMRIQSDEERDHALRFYQFVIDRDGAVSLGSIAAPDGDFSSPREVFDRALAYEREVTAAINDLYGLVTDMRDFASFPLLDWFVKEQVEEEAAVQQIIDDLERAGSEGATLLMIDRELGARTAGGAL